MTMNNTAALGAAVLHKGDQMKCTKMLGSLAVAATALMAFAATASATTGTDSAGGSPVEAGDTFHATNVGEAVFDGTISIKCKRSTVIGTVGNAGSATVTLSVSISTLTFEECGANTVTVIAKGSLEVHTDGPSADGYGVPTSSGAEVTILTHNILGTVHCIYVTENSYFGTIDGSNHTGGNATDTVDGARLFFKTTDIGCNPKGETEPRLTAEYTVSTPSYLAID